MLGYVTAVPQCSTWSMMVPTTGLIAYTLVIRGTSHLTAGCQSSSPEARLSLGLQVDEISEQRRAQIKLQLCIGGDDVGLHPSVFDDACRRNNKGRNPNRIVSRFDRRYTKKSDINTISSNLVTLD